MIKGIFGIGLVAAALAAAPAAHADTTPLPGCETGFMAVCDGPVFPDGSFWHYVNGFSGWRGVCTEAKGVLVPPPSPGGCGGAG